MAAPLNLNPLEAAELRARGVGFALAAWFVDPDRNSIGLLQLKNSDR
jgi:hypothetical protein